MVRGGGEPIMKKLLMISALIVFALTFGVAYAGDSMTMSSDMSKSWDNGITIFAAGPVSTGIIYRSISGAYGENELRAQGGESAALDNGVTLFASGPVSTGVNYKGVIVNGSDEGSAAGGMLYEEGPSLELHNGITVFDTGPVDAN